MSNHRTEAGVAIGGFAGAISRYGLSVASVQWGQVTLNILMINLVGAFLLAGFMEVSLERLRLAPATRTGISTGFLGAFTTFSGLCSDFYAISRTAGTGAAVGYLVISLLGGLTAALMGITVARLWIRHQGAAHE